MRTYPVLLISFLITLGSMANVYAQNSSAGDANLDVKVKAALDGELRTDAERERDRNRRPLQTLKFLGIQPDMRVLELIPGGGWYTKILAPTLRDEGELTVSLFAGRVKDGLVGQPGMDKIQVLEANVEAEDGEDNLRTVQAFDFGETGFDAVLTFRNMHNFDAAGRKNINAAVFKALKPGGIYGVVDHTRRHMEPITRENRRRADPVVIAKELLDAGFVFEDHSSLHYKPDDELRYEVGRKSVTGNSDRFTFLFRKPK